MTPSEELIDYAIYSPRYNSNDLQRQAWEAYSLALYWHGSLWWEPLNDMEWRMLMCFVAEMLK